MEGRHREAKLEESSTAVDEQDSVTLSEVVRMFLDFIADEAVRQSLTASETHKADGARDAADGDVPDGIHEQRPRR